MRQQIQTTLMVASEAESKNDLLYKKLMIRAFAVYAAPYGFMALFLLDQWVLGSHTEMFFVVLYMVSMLPCAILGLSYTTRAEDQKQFHSLPREIAWGAGIFLGVIGCLVGAGTFLGFLGLMAA
jgi:uncharacterized membrane protein YqjE